MNRPLQILVSSGVLIFDGLEAVTFVIDLETSVQASNVLLRNISPGQLYTVIVRQDGLGGHQIVWPATIHDASEVNTEPGSTSIISFIGDDTGEWIVNIPNTN